MKDIMTDCSMTDLRSTATEKWKEYTKAARAYKDPVYKDLQKVYNQVKNGQKVIDIGKVIAKGGVHKDIKPRLAIAKIGWKTVECTYYEDGSVTFSYPQSWQRRSKIHDVILSKILPLFKTGIQWQNAQKLQAPVPPVPPRFLPKKLTDDYYILWEVDEWKMIPPTDPYLLRRITKNMFVVLAGWDLTEIEKSVMAGRMI